MKNIHVLPTDKSSRIYTCGSALYINKVALEHNTNQNIYITSDEEIKEGDWYLNTLQNTIDKCEDIISKKNVNLSSWLKKIILTTDDQLIKDGVQPIDDEFLEWFVKNPSCEEVKTYLTKVLQSGNPTFYKDVYKIIIPKEEPNYNMKKEILIEMMNQDEELGLYDEPKQETLEESNQTTAIRFLEWYRRRGIIYQFHSYHIPMDDRKYLNALQLFEIFKKELYE